MKQLFSDTNDKYFTDKIGEDIIGQIVVDDWANVMFEVERIATAGTAFGLVPLAGSSIKRYPFRTSYNLSLYDAKECRFPTMREYEKFYLNSYSV